MPSTIVLSSALGDLVARQAGVVDIEQRTADMVVADLERPHALVGHVAIRAGDARARVDALAPHLELGMLRLERRSACVLVRPILEFDFIVAGENFIGLQALEPGIGQALFRPLEIVFHVALGAYIGPHLLARGHFIHVVVLDALMFPCKS